MSTKTKDKVEEKVIEPVVPEDLKKMLDKLVGPQAPNIDDTLAKAAEAIKAGQKAKQKKLQTWRCTECGNSGIQLFDTAGRTAHAGGYKCPHAGHFSCAVDESGEYVHTDGSTITDPHARRAITQVKRSGRITE